MLLEERRARPITCTEQGWHLYNVRRHVRSAVLLCTPDTVGPMVQRDADRRICDHRGTWRNMVRIIDDVDVSIRLKSALTLR